MKMIHARFATICIPDTVENKKYTCYEYAAKNDT